MLTSEDLDKTYTAMHSTAYTQYYTAEFRTKVEVAKLQTITSKNMTLHAARARASCFPQKNSSPSPITN